MSSSMKRTFMTNQLILKRYKEVRKLPTGKDEDYTTGCLLDYDYTNHYRLIAVDLSRQKELNAGLEQFSR